MAAGPENSGELGRHARRSQLPPRRVPLLTVSRRGFLAGGLGLGLGILDLERRMQAGGFALRAAASELAAEQTPNAVFGLRRPDDLLWLRVELFDIAIDGDTLKAGADATLVLAFQMQSILEQATFLEADDFPTPQDFEHYFDGYQDVSDLLLKRVPPPGQVRTVPAGLSRLAFAVPPGSVVPFTTEGILGAARTLTPRVVPAAQPVLHPVVVELQGLGLTEPYFYRKPLFKRDVPEKQEPTAVDTGIEAPWGLVLSPSEKGAWAHAPQASVAGARTELWHTRLGVRGGDGEPDETDETERVVRAVHNRRPDDPFDPNSMPLTAVNRDDIVKATTTYSDLSSEPDEFWPEAVQVESLSLSTLGAFLDVSGNWNPKGFPEAEGNFALEQWKHRMTSGRDQFARVVYRGYLFPFGHRVSLVEETERRFVGGPGEGEFPSPFVGAYLFKRAFIVVRERVKKYGGAYGQPDGGRRLPFRQLRLVTRVTPNLDSRFDAGVPFPFGWIYGGSPDHPEPSRDYQPFLPTIANNPFSFAFSGTDWDGHKSEFRAPAVFVFHGWWAYDADALAPVSVQYRGPAQEALRRRALHGQTVAFAPGQGNGSTERVSAGVPPRDAAQVVKELVFAPVNAKGSASGLEAADQPAFFPEMQEATVALSAAKEAAGKRVKEVSDLGDLVIEYYGRYVSQGFTAPTSASKLVAENANHGEVYAKVTRALGKSVLKFATNRSGGVATPNLDIVGLSRTLGPISAAAGIGKNAGTALDQIAANKFDPTTLLPGSAKLLGVLSLKKVVEALSGFVDTAGNVDERALQVLNDVGDEAIERRIVWRPQLSNGLPLLQVDDASSLTIEALVRVPLGNPDDVQSRTSGDLRNVTIHIFDATHPFVSIDIRRIGFTQKGTAKPSVVVDIGDVRFGKALDFVRKLASFMSSRDKPWWIDASAKGVEAGFALEIPSVGVGIFALSNISMRGLLEVPFTGDPVRFCFSFASRDDPFRVSVGIFGGGGFFGLCLRADGFESLEASFEFGLTASIDLGVASGSASMMGGIYYKVDGNGYAALEGYFRISGRLSILGIVSVSIELYLALSYLSKGNKVAGEAAVKVRISIGFFSLSKTVSAQRTFSEDASDPPFGEQMTVDDWSEYSSAFAAVAS